MEDFYWQCFRAPATDWPFGEFSFDAFDAFDAFDGSRSGLSE